jgi:oligogalacturonide lyase
LVFSRRRFLCSWAAASACFAGEKERIYPSELQRFKDPATEFDIYRLTDPANRSWLPASGRAISRRTAFLIYASDRSGSVQGYRLDMKTGQSEELTKAAGLIPDSLALTPDERSVCYLDGDLFMLVNLSNGRAREVYRLESGYRAGRGLHLSGDGLYAALVEQKEGTSRVRLIGVRTGTAATVTEASDVVSDPMPRPRRAGLLYRRGDDQLWVVNYDGAQNRQLRLAPGGVGPAFWSADGRTVLYLNIPADKTQLHSIREYMPDTNEDRLVANTTQFVAFSGNGDSSVFVGASGTKASPYILLLVRSVRRELTLCEHRSSDPAQANPMFSPSSQRIFFQSDRDGKMAIYAMVVDRLVAATDAEDH